MMTDPIADMLTRIRNANAINRKTVSMPASRLRVGIAEVLKAEGFIAGYEVLPGAPSSTMTIELKYGIDGEHVIRAIDRVSKPGRRVYAGVAEAHVGSFHLGTCPDVAPVQASGRSARQGMHPELELQDPGV